jgi:hypothetical protein
MPNGSVTASVEVEEARDATYRARLLVKGNEVAAAESRPLGKGGTAILDMRVSGPGLSMIAAASNRLPALLETIVAKSDGSVCRITSAALLSIRP